MPHDLLFLLCWLTSPKVTHLRKGRGLLNRLVCSGATHGFHQLLRAQLFDHLGRFNGPVLVFLDGILKQLCKGSGLDDILLTAAS